MNDPQLHVNWTTVFAFLAAVGQAFLALAFYAARGRLAPIEAGLARVAGKLDDVLDKINSLTSRIDRLEVRVAEHDTHDEQHKQWVRDEFGRIRDRQHELANQVQTLQARVGLHGVAQ